MKSRLDKYGVYNTRRRAKTAALRKCEYKPPNTGYWTLAQHLRQRQRILNQIDSGFLKPSRAFMPHPSQK